jgi:hypothetical protein
MAVGILLLVLEGKTRRGFSHGKMECKGSSSARTIHKVFSRAKTLVVLSSDLLPIRISEAIVEGGGTRIRVFKAKTLVVVLVISIKDLLMVIVTSTTEVTTHTVSLIGSNTIIIGLIFMATTIGGMVPEVLGIM